MADKMASYSPSDAKVLKKETMVRLPFPLLVTTTETRGSQKPDEAKWIRLNKIDYQDPSGKQRIWESAERQVSALFME